MVITGSEDATVRVFDPKSGNPLHVFQGHNFHTDIITTLCSQPTNASILMTGSADGTAKLLNIQTGKIHTTLNGHADSIETVGFCQKCVHTYY